MSKELALECVKIAIPLVSPSVDDRFSGIAEISEKIYIHIQKLSGETPVNEVQAEKPRRGRPPKSCDET